MANGQHVERLIPDTADQDMPRISDSPTGSVIARMPKVVMDTGTERVDAWTRGVPQRDLGSLAQSMPGSVPERRAQRLLRYAGKYGRARVELTEKTRSQIASLWFATQIV
jgi:hypothetical protein